MLFVYALYSTNDNKFYIGLTNDIKRRIFEHKSEANHTTARLDEPRLTYYECFENDIDARRREKYLKTTQGKKGLRLILRETLKT